MLEFKESYKKELFPCNRDVSTMAKLNAKKDELFPCNRDVSITAYLCPYV